MNEFEYLQQASEEEILNTWFSMGSITVTPYTKVYTKGSLIRVNCGGADGLSKAVLHNRIIYVLEDYRVDNQTYFNMDWEELGIDDVGKMRVAVQGVQLPYFGVLNAKYSESFMPDRNFIPFNDPKIQDLSGGISISDDELSTILTVIGFPFASFDDIEYSKSQIIKYMIRPAMQRYFTFRPIIQEEGYGMINANTPFQIEFPENAYGAIPYYCSSPNIYTNTVQGNPFLTYATYMHTAGMTGSKFGRGVHYYGKQVPGPVGGINERWQTFFDTNAFEQGLANYFRREKYQRKKIDGKWYATGFSTIGGNLNIKWLCQSNDWDDVKPEDLEVFARPMARSEVLNNFYVLRSLVKTDIAGQLDASVLKSQRDEIEQNLKPMLASIGLTGAMAARRGGG